MQTLQMKEFTVEVKYHPDDLTQSSQLRAYLYEHFTMAVKHLRMLEGLAVDDSEPIIADIQFGRKSNDRNQKYLELAQLYLRRERYRTKADIVAN